MSSGNFAGAAGWNNTGKPSQAPVCAQADPEPRGPGVFLAGLCCTCGRATTGRDREGLPRHAQIIPVEAA